MQKRQIISVFFYSSNFTKATSRPSITPIYYRHEIFFSLSQSSQTTANKKNKLCKKRHTNIFFENFATQLKLYIVDFQVINFYFGKLYL